MDRCRPVRRDTYGSANACDPTANKGLDMTIVKQAAFSLAFAIITVAIAEFALWAWSGAGG